MNLVALWCSVTNARLYSPRPEHRFCAGLNPARGTSEICDNENLLQWSRMEIRLDMHRRSTIQQKQFIIFIVIWSSHRRCSVRKVFLEISQNSHEKNLCQSLFFNKVAGKETLAQVFFCEIWETKKTFSYRTPLGNCFCFIMKVIDVTRNKNPGLLNR